MNYEQLYDAYLADQAALEADACRDLAIDRDSPIEGYLYTQAQDYFKWATLAAISEARAAAQKYRVKEELWPLARAQARTVLKASGERITESQVDDCAAVNAAYRSGQTKLVELEEVAGTLRAAERAMAQRLEMLRSLNSRQRVEFGGLSQTTDNLNTRDVYQASRKTAKH